MRALTLFLVCIATIFSPCAAAYAQSTEGTKTEEVDLSPWSKDAKRESLEQNKMFNLVIKMVIALAITIAVALLASFVAKKFFSGYFPAMNKEVRIQLVERKAISPKASISIVKIDDDEFFIAETANSFTLLAQKKNIQTEDNV